MYTIVKNCRDNDILRASFDKLAQTVFGLTFEDWYQNGYWREHYIPYSMVKDGEVVANVSVNRMDMLVEGEKKRLIQLGTVMTVEGERHQGHIRSIMEEIERDYRGKADGVYLFANDSVQDFYPKFGFHRAKEYQYTKVLLPETAAIGGSAASGTMHPVAMHNKAAWDVLEHAICSNRFRSRLDMADYSELYLFYVTKFMQENVYFEETLGAYAIAEIEDDELLLHAVFADHDVDLEAVIRSFGNGIRKVTLGFAPADAGGYTCREWQEEDTALFVKGEAFAGFDGRKLLFPTLSHA